MAVLAARATVTPGHRTRPLPSILSMLSIIIHIVNTIIVIVIIIIIVIIITSSGCHHHESNSDDARAQDKTLAEFVITIGEEAIYMCVCIYIYIYIYVYTYVHICIYI